MKKTFLLLALFVAAVWGRPERAAAGDDARPALPRPVMVDAANGWWQKVTRDNAAILRTTDGGAQWQDVSPAGVVKAARTTAKEEDMFLPGVATLCVLDTRRAWVAYCPQGAGQDATGLAFTGDGGAHWKEVSAPVVTNYYSVFTFVDERHGFVLGDQRERKFYATDDGGERWYVLGDAPASGEATAQMTFLSPTEGWLASTSQDEDGDPVDSIPAGTQSLFHTTDGGATWKQQKFAVPDGYQHAMVNVYAPVFASPEKKLGYLPVEFIQENVQPASGKMPPADIWITYESGDGGQSWHLPTNGPSVMPGG